MAGDPVGHGIHLTVGHPSVTVHCRNMVRRSPALLAEQVYQGLGPVIFEFLALAKPDEVLLLFWSQHPQCRHFPACISRYSGDKAVKVPHHLTHLAPRIVFVVVGTAYAERPLVVDIGCECHVVEALFLDEEGAEAERGLLMRVGRVVLESEDDL